MRYRALPGDHALAQLMAMTRCAGGLLRRNVPRSAMSAEGQPLTKLRQADPGAAPGLPEERDQIAGLTRAQCAKTRLMQRSKLPGVASIT